MTKTDEKRWAYMLSLPILVGVVWIAIICTVKTPYSLSVYASTRHEDKSLLRMGQEFTIYQPIFNHHLMGVHPLLASPETWIASLEDRFNWLDSMTHPVIQQSRRERARQAYLEVLKMHVSGKVFQGSERRVVPQLNSQFVEVGTYDDDVRQRGEDWTYLGVTMTGVTRLNNVQNLLGDVFRNKIPGDFIESGVWRGGSSIFARGVLRAFNEGNRISYVCDSFQGLPPGDRGLDNGDKNWNHTPYLEVSTDRVARNFADVDLLDSNVVFAQGLFNETMRPLAEEIEAIAIMRLDGDMYESTVDVLYNLYEKLSIGGYVIMDDWYGFPAKTACEDFFAAHSFQPEIIQIDNLSAYWQKKAHIDVQYWRYEQGLFK